MSIRMSVGRCCCVSGCANHTCWYDIFDGYTVGDDIVEIPLSGLNSASKPYRARPVGGLGGAYTPDTDAVVATGNLLEISKFNPTGQTVFGISKGWGVSSQSDLHTSGYSNRSIFGWTVDSWDRDGDSTNNILFGLRGYYQMSIYIVESGSSFTPYFEITNRVSEVQQYIPMPSMSHPSGLLSKFEIELYDGVDEGVVSGQTGTTASSFEWKVKIDDLIVLESMTGTTRNYEKTLFGTTDWCELPKAFVDVNNSSTAADPTLTLSEWRISIAGDDGCVPSTP